MRAVAPDVEVVVAPTPELDAVVELMAVSLSATEESSYLEAGTVGEDVVADLFASARLLHTVAPRKRGAEQQLLRLDIPALGVQGACVATMGALGEAVGVNVFPSLDHFEDVLEAIESMADEAGELFLPEEGTGIDFASRVLSLSFVSGDELPPVMLREANEHGWEPAASGVYPWPQNRASDGVSEPVGECRMQVLAAFCGAFTAFSVKHDQLFERESFEPVCESFVNDDDVEVRLTMPYEAWPLFEVNEPPLPERFEDADDLRPLPRGQRAGAADLQPPAWSRSTGEASTAEPSPRRTSRRPREPARRRR